MKKIFTFILTFFLATASLSCSSSMFHNSRNSKNDETVKEFRYLAFGDSISSLGKLADISDSYPCVVADILNCNVSNKAIDGSSLVYYDGRPCIVNDVVNVSNGVGKYDIISVTGGTNDRSLNSPLGDIDDCTNETIYGSLNVIANTLKTNYPDAFIFFITPIKNKLSEVECANGYNLEDVSNAIKEVASIYHIPVLDLYNTSQFETVDCGMNSIDCDGTHPTAEFIKKYMAPQIATFIKKNY